MPVFPQKLLLVLLVTSIVPGCAPRSAAVPQAVADQSSANGPASPTDPVAKKEFQLGDLLAPFTPPALPELESNVTWIDRPVVDSIERLREQQSHGKPTGTVEQALAARNDSPDANDLICSVLGRLPESDAEIEKDATLVRHTAMDMKSSNPLMGSSVMEFDIATLTSVGLFSFDRDFQPFASADTVVSWQSSKDRLYDKVVMRDDLTWSDGRPITAHDVAFSFRVIMSRDVPIPAVRSGTDQLKDVHAYDDHTLVYFHKESLATNDWNVNFPIIPKHIYEKSIAEDPKLQVSDYHTKLENSPVVGGPFRIVERNFGKDVVLEARPEYYLHQGKQVRRPPHFKKVRFRIITEHSVALLAMKRGDIDEMILQPEQWQTQTKDADFHEKCTKAFGTEWVNFHFIWNCKSPYFSDKRVRQAMSYAF
ncbi:MAG: ABC transporter substrate-binding protein, partial [Planctomycetota bacterium]|nr:ABC transporter substrate-binding protein [Planctomycetota bacterium]